MAFTSSLSSHFSLLWLAPAPHRQADVEEAVVGTPRSEPEASRGAGVETLGEEILEFSVGLVATPPLLLPPPPPAYTAALWFIVDCVAFWHQEFACTLDFTTLGHMIV